MKSRHPLVVEVVRGNAVESQHQVMTVVADERGLVSSFWGNVDYLTFPRSAIKPLQALALVESGAMEKFGLDEKILALACASHTGEKHHLVSLHHWLEKIKLKESDLYCGPAYPSHEATRHDMIKKNQPPAPLLNNCSGKHLGIISSCLALGEDFKDYHRVDHPAQVRLRKILSDLMKTQLERMPVGIDGCAIPTHATPLQNIAIGMSEFFDKKDLADGWRKSLQRILHAWRYNPTYVSGSHDFASDLALKTKGRALLKPGAEGAYCGLMPEKGYAFALKVADGDGRAAEVAAAAIFRHHGALTEEEAQDLKQWTQPVLRNTRNDVVGLIKLAGNPF